MINMPTLRNHGLNLHFAQTQEFLPNYGIKIRMRTTYHYEISTAQLNDCIPCKLSVESQKGVIAIQRCSIENQKGALAIDFVQQ